MDYLQSTLKYLEEENRELKDKLKRISDLNHLITKQRETEERDYLQRFHQEEIAVIREIAETNEKSLKNQIKKLNQEIVQLNTAIQQKFDAIVTLRKEVQQLENQNCDLLAEVDELRRQLKEAEETHQQSMDQFEMRYSRLQEEYRGREEEVMEKYMAKLEQRSDKHEEEMRKQNKFIDFLQNKLNSVEKEKELLSEEVGTLIATLTQEEQRITTKNRAASEEVNELKKENNNLKVYIKNIEIEIADLEAQKNSEMNRANKWQKQFGELKIKQKELERSKNKEIERQKSKNKSIVKDLSQQKKFLKDQIDKEKKLQSNFNNSKKLLINKIKEIENKYEHEKSARSVFDKTTTKTVKKSLETFQSISLDNSLNKEKESPSVSCFLKDEKCQIKSNAKRELKIDTSNHINLLRLKDLDTPCFQTSKAKNIKRTIKIRK